MTDGTMPSMERSMVKRPTAFQVEQIGKTYSGLAGQVTVLQNLSFSAEAETWVTLLGPSGCGKTTLLRILSGLEPPDAGSVTVHGRRGFRLGAMAYLPQQDTLLPWRTALENAVLSSEVDRRPADMARREAIELFGQFGLSGFESLYPNQLSGGMRQRLALIRTFLAHRSVLLLDEPLGALDPLTRATLQQWLLSVWSELRKTVLLVTHDPEEALLLSDRILVLSDRPASILRDERVDLARPRDRSAQLVGARRMELLRLLLKEGEEG
jgi:ABC-type nitrate/sulfonate/bicarbonate transport system ATPase subunit